MASRGVPTVGRYRTDALGTSAEILVADVGVTGPAAELLELGLDWIDRLASRFRADSELSALNASAGQPFHASPDLLGALQVALRTALLTDGFVTPTVGRALCAIGYDRDFTELLARTDRDGPAPTLTPEPVPDWRDIRIDVEDRVVELPAEMMIDLGSTAKAWAADCIAAGASSQLGCGVLVSLGGDISVAGPAPGGGWTVGLADRCTDEPAIAREVVSISSGAIATSGTSTRTWTVDGRRMHHLIHPATGLPTQSCWRSVSVAAGNCVDANSAATAAMLMGEDAPDWLGARELPALLVTVGGARQRVGAWPGQVED